MKTIRLTALSALALAVLGASAQAQAAAETKPATPGRGQGNFEDFRKRFEERIKTSLKATDEEWTVLKPLIDNVSNKQRDARGGFGGGRQGGTGGTGGGTETPRPGAAESQALQTTLENESSTPEEVKAKLAAVRDVRKKNQAALAQAREELRKVLTVRQEAALVGMGLLE